MKRLGMTWAVAMVLGLTILLTACSGKPAADPTTPPASRGEPTAPAPTTEPKPTPPPSTPEPAPAQALPEIPGDLAALQAALAESSPLTYRIAMADAPQGADKTKFLDEMLGTKGYPGKNEVLLLVFPKDNFDIRFAMGALLFEKKVSVQAMLDMVRQNYLTKARIGDPAGGLADLVRAVNSKVK